MRIKGYNKNAEEIGVMLRDSARIRQNVTLVSLCFYSAFFLSSVATIIVFNLYAHIIIHSILLTCSLERFPAQWDPFGKKNQMINPRWEEEDRTSDHFLFE